MKMRPFAYYRDTSVYWMAGLSPHADRFFKYLFILVLYSLAMVQFVRVSTRNNPILELTMQFLTEFCSRGTLPEWWHRHSTLIPLELVYDDLCGLL